MPRAEIDEQAANLLWLTSDDVILDPVTDVRNVKGLDGDLNAEMDSLAALGKTVKDIGQLQPIVVRPGSNGRYRLVCGRRRFKVAQALKQSVPAIVRDLTDDQALQAALTENIQRKSMSPVALSQAIARIRSDHGWEGPAGAVQVARYLGVGKTTVLDHERLGSLPTDILERVHRGELTVTAAIDLATVEAGSRQAVAEAATMLAEDEAGGKPRRRSSKAAERTGTPGTGTPAPVTVRRRHIVEAAREARALTTDKRRSYLEVVELLKNLGGPSYPKPMSAFIDCLLNGWIPGKLGDNAVMQRWTAIAHAIEHRIEKAPPRIIPSQRAATTTRPKARQIVHGKIKSKTVKTRQLKSAKKKAKR